MATSGTKSINRPRRNFRTQWILRSQKGKIASINMSVRVLFLSKRISPRPSPKYSL